MAREISDRRIMRRYFRPGYQRPFWLLVVLLLAIGAGRVALTPIVDAKTRAALARLPNAQATYRELSIFSYPPVVVLEDVAVNDVNENRVLTVPRMEVHFAWRDVIRGIKSGAWPSPPPSVRVRLVEPSLAIRSDDPVQLAADINGLVAGLPPAAIEVAAVERAHVVVRGNAMQPALLCARELNAKGQEFAFPNLPTTRIEGLCAKAKAPVTKAPEGATAQNQPTPADAVVFMPTAALVAGQPLE
ncbi:MAG TPA: hypothetical protein VGF45_24585 [Polyangia bacterium]